LPAFGCPEISVTGEAGDVRHEGIAQRAAFTVAAASGFLDRWHHDDFEWLRRRTEWVKFGKLQQSSRR
jgi:hypothetical protein